MLKDCCLNVQQIKQKWHPNEDPTDLIWSAHNQTQLILLNKLLIVNCNVCYFALSALILLVRASSL